MIITAQTIIAQTTTTALPTTQTTMLQSISCFFLILHKYDYISIDKIILLVSWIAYIEHYYNENKVKSEKELKQELQENLEEEKRKNYEMKTKYNELVKNYNHVFKKNQELIKLTEDVMNELNTERQKNRKRKSVKKEKKLSSTNSQSKVKAFVYHIEFLDSNERVIKTYIGSSANSESNRFRPIESLKEQCSKMYENYDNLYEDSYERITHCRLLEIFLLKDINNPVIPEQGYLNFLKKEDKIYYDTKVLNIKRAYGNSSYMNKADKLASQEFLEAKKYSKKFQQYITELKKRFKVEELNLRYIWNKKKPKPVRSSSRNKTQPHSNLRRSTRVRKQTDFYKP